VIEIYPKNIFCIEGIQYSDSNSSMPTQATLEVLAENDDILISYKTCSNFEEFESVLSSFLFEEKINQEFEMIYFALKGKPNYIEINDEFLSLEELADLFEGKFENKMIHFGGDSILRVSDEEIHYFMEITNASSVSGYSLDSPLLATLAIDALFFETCQKFDEFSDIKLGFYKKYTKFCAALGFRMYC
jgi:hypothetical protein